MLWHLLAAQPEIALFASLAIGFLIGSFKLGPIQLGGVCGTLIVALILGQSGARISPDLKNIAFALFIFALGFTGGPQFFANIGKGWRYGALSVVEVVVVVTLVLCAVKLLRLDAGTAAGLLAGGATESAVIGTASEAIGRLGLDAAETARLQANIVTAYSVSYLFGLVTIVLFASQFAPLILRVNLREESERVWRKLGGDGALAEGQTLAMPPLVSRELKVTAAAGRSLGELEKQFGQNISVQRVLRDRSVIKAQPSLVLKAGDRVLVGGRREALVAAIPVIGEEVGGGGLPDVYVERVDVMLTRPELHGLTLAQARARVAPQEGRGVFVAAVTRLDSTIPALPGTQVHRGDVLTLVGNKEDVARGASKLGYIIRATQKTDFVFLGLGVLLGIAVGRLSVRAGGIDLTLGTGAAACLPGCCSAGSARAIR